jgi:hypothetical protein
MNNRDYVIMISLIALTVLSSFFLTYYGVNIVMSGTAPGSTLTFSYVTIAYGLGSLAILSLAWSSRETWSVTVIKLFALCYLGVVVMDAFRHGLQDGLEIIRILALAVVLCANWLAVKKVVERD